MDKGVVRIKFTDYETSVTEALDAISASDVLPEEGSIIIKPNLINKDGPPVTTNVAIVEAIYKYCRPRTDAEIMIGEGCGEGTTWETFKANGYTDLAERNGIRLVDLNREKTVTLKNDRALQLKHFHIPEVVRDAFVISVPVLKDHSLTVTTISMKNMFGIAPASHYKGAWNKSKLHSPSTLKACIFTARKGNWA
ncbi:MAG: DUF362 domain-containing protein [Deltaproteobacteria bacterium]|nr:DUF362 domain-containing protein [Deltaproteobacteria bacterium]